MKSVSGLLGLAVKVSLVMIFCYGCAHQLEVKNIDDYRNNTIRPAGKPVTIGIISSTEGEDIQQIVKGTGTALGKYSANVILPYSPERDKNAEILADIAVTPEYKGSGWNFLINFPGFLIFTPAWNGYVYGVDYNVDILLTKASDNSKIDSWTMPINLNLRHAEIDRTWTEISYLEFGVIALFGGIAFVQYDPDVTPLLGEKIGAPVGDYIAQEIINHLNNNGVLTSQPASDPPASAVVTASPSN